MKKELSVILLAGGKGLRLGHEIPKQYLLLGGKPIFTYSLDIFLKMPEVGEIVIVADSSYRPFFQTNDSRIVYADPGKERQNSVYQGLLASDAKLPYIAVHDAARPFISEDLVRKTIESAKKYGATAPALAVKETIKEANKEGAVIRTVPRKNLFTIQTPQIIRRDLLLTGFEKVKQMGAEVTDDLSIVEYLDLEPHLVPGDEKNIKITSRLDMKLAEILVLDMT